MHTVFFLARESVRFCLNFLLCARSVFLIPPLHIFYFPLSDAFIHFLIKPKVHSKATSPRVKRFRRVSFRIRLIIESQVSRPRVLLAQGDDFVAGDVCHFVKRIRENHQDQNYTGDSPVYRLKIEVILVGQIYRLVKKDV